MMKQEYKGTTRTGYINKYGQKNLGRTQPPRPGNRRQYLYIMECTQCGKKYGSNGSDIFHRRCPCQGGKEGPKLRAEEVALVENTGK
jgi:hypothetical protein